MRAPNSGGGLIACEDVALAGDVDTNIWRCEPGESVTARIAFPDLDHIRGTCLGGSNDDTSCVSTNECVGGSRDGLYCWVDGDCTGGGTCEENCTGGGHCTSYFTVEPHIRSSFTSANACADAWLTACPPGCNLETLDPKSGTEGSSTTALPGSAGEMAPYSPITEMQAYNEAETVNCDPGSCSRAEMVALLERPATGCTGDITDPDPNSPLVNSTYDIVGFWILWSPRL